MSFVEFRFTNKVTGLKYEDSVAVNSEKWKDSPNLKKELLTHIKKLKLEKLVNTSMYQGSWVTTNF